MAELVGFEMRHQGILQWIKTNMTRADMSSVLCHLVLSFNPSSVSFVPTIHACGNCRDVYKDWLGEANNHIGK
jgi:hypothetical protein